MAGNRDGIYAELSMTHLLWDWLIAPVGLLVWLLAGYIGVGAVKTHVEYRLKYHKWSWQWKRDA